MYAVQESNLKQTQTKAYAADVCNTAAPMGAALSGRPATLAEQLEKNSEASHKQASEYGRAAYILRTHPEFEDLIWLIRSGLI